jgi:acetyltransferase
MPDPSPRHPLAPLFEPGSIAVAGATERPGAIGAVVLANLRAAGFAGRLVAVNPKYPTVQGVRCVPSVAALGEPVDLLVVTTPAATVPGLIEDAGRLGIRAAVVISAGFGEAGAAGAALDRELRAAARRHGVRVLGPNCLGLMRPSLGVDATFALGGASPGALGLLSQSGAICTALIDWARPRGIGFSSLVSLGASTDVDFGEALDYLTQDPATRHILLYVEGIREAGRFVEALRAAAAAKPVFILKSGRHPTGVRAAVSHTGAMVGADDVFDAVVRRAGAVRVRTLGQLVATAQALADGLRPVGRRLAVITNAGGPGVLAADRAADADLDVELATLAPATVAALQAALPAHWSHGNPVDLIGDADAVRYDAAVAACLADDGVDGLLVMLTPQAMTAPTRIAEALRARVRGATKPVLACWMGDASVSEARALLQHAGIPTFGKPESAVETFAHVAAWSRNQAGRAAATLAAAAPPPAGIDLPAARAVLAAARAESRTLLTGAESRALLRAFGIPVVEPQAAATAEAAVACAAALGYPVALKIDSPDITHKSDVGGVRLGLGDARAVRAAFDAILQRAARERPAARLSGVTVERMEGGPGVRELLVGILRDPVFGPVVAFGAGGVAVELYGDRAVELPPLDRALAVEMVARTRVARRLGAFRGGEAASVESLYEVLQRVAAMATGLRELAELDINPLLLDARGALALDARVVLVPPAACDNPDSQD